MQDPSPSFSLSRPVQQIQPIHLSFSPLLYDDKLGAMSMMCKSAIYVVERLVWTPAKSHALVNDSGIQQLISHWLCTHAIMESFVISMNRHLNILHPINKLLVPHYRDTMNINAQAHHALINADSLLEFTFFPGK